MSDTKHSSISLLRLPKNNVADCVLFLKDDKTIPVFGALSIRRVIGSLSVYGHNIKDEGWHSLCVYSPNVITLDCRIEIFDSRCLLTRVQQIFTDKNELITNMLSSLLKGVINGCILLINSAPVLPNSEPWFDTSVALPTKESRVHVLCGHTADQTYSLFSAVPSTLAPLAESSNWPDFAAFVNPESTIKDTRAPVILVCGGKGVGKSTFGRYCVNNLLNTQKQLCFLDTDVGQSEFTPPGVLSLNVVDKPIFGPPFSHLSRPAKACFFGDVSPKDRPSSYVRFVYDLYSFYQKNYSEVPLVVNTHGWVKGMGIRILVDIVRIVQPTYIVQINFESEPTKNLPKLTEEFFMQESGWNYWTNEEQWSSSDWKCSNIYHVNSYQPNPDLPKSPHSSERRLMSLISYFGSYSSSLAAISADVMNSCPVYSREIKSLKIYNAYSSVSASHIFYAINGSIVGLLKMDDEMGTSGPTDTRDTCVLNDVPCGEYVGLGLVRNIDPENGVLYIITPEPPEKLALVNALVNARLTVPDSLWKKRKFEATPYVTSEFTYKHKGSGQKKMRYNLLRQKSKSPRADNAR